MPLNFLLKIFIEKKNGNNTKTKRVQLAYGRLAVTYSFRIL